MHSEETKAKISLTVKKRWREGVFANQPKRHSETLLRLYQNPEYRARRAMLQRKKLEHIWNSQKFKKEKSDICKLNWKTKKHGFSGEYIASRLNKDWKTKHSNFLKELWKKGCYSNHSKQIKNKWKAGNYDTEKFRKNSGPFAKKYLYGKISMRSKWETRYAKFLTEKNISWQYEPKIFIFKNGKRYIPDFYLPEKNEWHEVKGWMDERSKQKLEMFKQEFTNENLVIIDASVMKSVN
jgi:hypothetical protein